MGFLGLSALWVAWRHRFKPLGLALAPVAFFGGMMFLAIYVLIVGAKAPSVRALLLGEQDAARAA